MIGTITKAGKTLTLDGSSSGLYVGGLILGVPVSSDLVIAGAVTDTLVLSGASTYNGTTTAVTGTTISVRGNGSLGDTFSGTVVDSGASLAVNTILYKDAEALTINGITLTLGGTGANNVTCTVISGASQVTVGAASGASNFACTIVGTGGSIIKDGTNTVTGGATVNWYPEFHQHHWIRY